MTMTGEDMEGNNNSLFRAIIQVSNWWH